MERGGCTLNCGWVMGSQLGTTQVAMLMRRAGLAGLSGNRSPRRRPRPVDTPVDLVDRNFARSKPDQLWVTDITEHPTREGRVYCAVVLDVFSRRVVGWSIDNSATSGLVTSALGMAISNRQPHPGTVIHSDQGTQFTSWAFTQRAHESGLVPSMGTVGDCFDNALMESFWARMQVELLDRQRRHTAIQMHTPIEYETNHYHNRTVTPLIQVS